MMNCQWMVMPSTSLNRTAIFMAYRYRTGRYDVGTFPDNPDPKYREVLVLVRPNALKENGMATACGLMVKPPSSRYSNNIMARYTGWCIAAMDTFKRYHLFKHQRKRPQGQPGSGKRLPLYWTNAPALSLAPVQTGVHASWKTCVVLKLRLKWMWCKSHRYYR